MQSYSNLQATELRLQPTHLEDLSTKRQSLAEQIKRSQEQDDFIEADLRRWKEKLDDLNSNLILSLTIVINQHDNVPLVHNISISFVSIERQESFDRVFNNSVQIEEDGAAVSPPVT